jgi:hypothetical protein
LPGDEERGAALKVGTAAAEAVDEASVDAAEVGSGAGFASLVGVPLASGVGSGASRGGSASGVDFVEPPAGVVPGRKNKTARRPPTASAAAAPAKMAARGTPAGRPCGERVGLPTTTDAKVACAEERSAPSTSVGSSAGTEAGDAPIAAS